MKVIMNKADPKFYVCIHTDCGFKTEKRKAIYTHLVRTHCERKEDFECEYCSLVFHDENSIERHLSEHHASQPFTYTCVSRIEHVISKCAKLGAERRRSHTPGQAGETDKQAEKKVSNERLVENWLNSSTKVKTEIDSQDENLGNDIDRKTDSPVGSNFRTKASVNASLNNIAKTAMLSEDNIKKEYCGEEEQLNYESKEHEPNTVSSPPPGLKIKLNLKQIAECVSSRELSASPPLLERHVASPEVALDSSDISPTPPNIIQGQSNHGVSIREKASKYYDRLEVYHTTDGRGMRCCPFCPYKTSKNTIRVHLSGIHKIHFVKCSLCEYKAAFPHQITQHGVKFHKTTNLNVIQLSKESRDKTIAKLTKSTQAVKSNYVAPEQDDTHIETEPIIEYDRPDCSYMDDVISSGSCSPSEEEEHQGTTTYQDIKLPKTMKTHYFSILYENGACVYSCNLCSFRTAVRATIYTHKYRHEQKSYRCGYCDFVSFPRSNVAHHCRSRHKDKPIKIEEIGEVTRDESSDLKQSGGEQHDDNLIIQPLDVKQEPVDDSYDTRGPSFSATKLENKTSHDVPQEITQRPNSQSNTARIIKKPPTIIKVPEFKRSFMSMPSSQTKKMDDLKKRKNSNQTQSGYKLSLNKLYRFNPVGAPKYMCAKCPYACDTHPKMKHHLYRHRPQRYKCPYCEHRKYPRSYVVRHVRDTHRGKPLRVLDLLKDELSQDDNEGGADYDEDDYQDTEFEMSEHTEFENSNDTHSTNATGNAVTVKTEPLDSDSADPNSNTSSANSQKDIKLPASCKTLADRLQLNLSRDFSDKMFSQTPDVSPNFSETVFTSTPMIESIINNGQFPATPKPMSKMHERKKSLKDYRVNAGPGSRYICNKCNYGTDNYKTIHNHMYRHESQRYQCPYCGYRRSPRSFVENHIREVHKGNPVIVTELTENLESGVVPIGSPRQCVNLKRKEPLPPVRTESSSPVKKAKLKGSNSLNATTKLPVKWPAPKPAANVNLSPSKSSPKLQKPLKQEVYVPDNKHRDAHVSRTNDSGENGLSSPTSCDTGFNLDNSTAKNSQGATGISNSNQSQPFRFKEGSRTTFKTMYKCVFDPETCNHISKDKSKMKQHLFMHVEYKPWSCDFCDMTASQSSHIKNHVRTEHPGISVKSFKFKKHNYLEKHIEGFLSKSLFTVPVSEYRQIMDMKGNSKRIPRPYKRDDNGFIICPYCDYRTKSGVMTDHVKMKHMQARFKCHWCNYSAFYRSEVRKHHRKERSHADLEFKTQELDLSQVLSGKDGVYSSRNNDQTDNIIMSVENEQDLQIDGNDHVYSLDDDDSDMSSNCSSDCDDSDNNMYSNCSSVEDITDSAKREMSPAQSDLPRDIGSLDSVDHKTNSEHDSDIVATGPDINVKTKDLVCNRTVVDTGNGNTQIRQNKFQCGYCSFSASLRVKVKMHCSKKHQDREVQVLEPNADKGAGKTKSKDDVSHLGVVEHFTRVDANDWKGTKFEQDLRRAGVSKLNLASLFPKTKKIKLEYETNPNNGETHRTGGNKKLPDVECHADMVVVEAEHTVENLRAIPLNNVHSPSKLDIQPPKIVQKSSEPEFKVPKPPSPILKLHTNKPSATVVNGIIPAQGSTEDSASTKTISIERMHASVEQDPNSKISVVTPCSTEPIQAAVEQDSNSKISVVTPCTTEPIQAAVEQDSSCKINLVSPCTIEPIQATDEQNSASKINEVTPCTTEATHPAVEQTSSSETNVVTPCTTEHISAAVEQNHSSKMNVVKPDLNESNLSVSTECSDKADIIVEPLEPANSENYNTCLDNICSIVASESEMEQEVEELEDTIPEALPQGNDITPCLKTDVNTGHMEAQPTEPEVIMTVPNLTPVVLEMEESAYSESDQTVLENDILC